MAGAGTMVFDVRLLQVDVARQAIQKAEEEQLDGPATRAMLREVLDAVEVTVPKQVETRIGVVP